MIEYRTQSADACLLDSRRLPLRRGKEARRAGIVVRAYVVYKSYETRVERDGIRWITGFDGVQTARQSFASYANFN